jgi:hypothetical protein
MSGPTPREMREAGSRDGEPFDDSHLERSYKRTDTYKYVDADGTTLLYEQLRYEPDESKMKAGVDGPDKKKYLTRRYDPDYERLPAKHKKIDKHRWIFGAGDRRVIYNWPALIKLHKVPVHVMESEHNADALNRRGLLAIAVLSHKWTPELAAMLYGRECFIYEDHGDTGRKIAAAAYKELSKFTNRASIISAEHLWNHLPSGHPAVRNEDDVEEWLEYGGDHSKLIAICREVPAEGVITTEPHNFPEESTIPMWDWIYKKHLLRGTVAGTAAMGGTGKSTLSICEAIALAAGKPLLGNHSVNVNSIVPRRVLLVNLEDDRKTMDKRVAAVMKSYKLVPGDVGDRLHIIAKGELKLKLARYDRSSGLVARNEPQLRGLTDLLVEKKIDVLSVDPLISTHSVNENDNSQMRDVIEIYDDIAQEGNCAVHLWQHTRKGNGDAASISSVRGASSIVDACRSIRILETMNDKDAKALGIHNPGFFFREFSGKRNFAPPAEVSTWYELVGIEMDNGPLLFGDNVSVVVPWKMPDAKDTELAADVIEKIKEAVGIGEWAEHVLASNWIGKAVGSVLGKDAVDDRAYLKGIVKKLIDDKILKRKSGWNKDRSEPRVYVVLAGF